MDILEETENKKIELLQNLLEKDQILTQKDRQIELIKEDINTLKMTIHNLNQENQLIKDKYEKKITDIISNSDNNQEIFDKIEEILFQKGFISDREYENIAKKINYQLQY